MTDLGTFDTFYLPPSLADLPGERSTEVIEAGARRLTLRHFQPSADGLVQLTRHLRAQARQLRALPTPRIVEVFDQLAGMWLDTLSIQRRRLVAAISLLTGLSEAMVAHAIDLEQRSSRAEDLRRALTQELGPGGLLDDFTPNPWLAGRSLAVGPELVGSVFSGNIPALPHLEVMRAMLVKAALLGKVASDEPLFLPAWARDLGRVEPLMGEALAVVRLSRTDTPLRQQVARSVDVMVVYGGREAVSSWRSLTPASVGFVAHGHKLGLAAVSREAQQGDVQALCDALAYDFSLFDHEACLSPVVLYLEEAGERSEAFVRQLCGGMARWASRLPPRRMSLPQSAARRAWLDHLTLDGGEIIDSLPGLPGVVVQGGAPSPTPLPPGRCLRVVRVGDLAELPRMLAPSAELLQCAALAGPPARIGALGRELALLGTTRIVRPGLMGTPSMMWRHDGVGSLSRLVRFCDWEVVAPGEG